MKNVLMPTRIVSSSMAENAECLFIEKPSQPSTFAKDFMTLRLGGYILLDFGREIRGGVNIAVQSVSSPLGYGKCHLIFGESVGEASSTLGKCGATNDHAIRDTVIDLPALGTAKFGNTGFRFLRLEAIDSEICIKSIVAELDTLDIERVGEFESSDELINRVWDVGAYTAYLNMGEYIFDGIKRDRLVWAGDMHPEVSTILAAYGDHASIKNSLDFLKNDTPCGEWINKIPSYSLWWVIIQYDYYLYTGNIDYLKDECDFIKDIVKRACEVAKENPNDFNFFADWSSSDDYDERRAAFYSVMYKCFKTALKIAEATEDDELHRSAAEGASAVEALKIEVPNQKQVAAIAAYSGLASNKAANLLVLRNNPTEGLSAFFGYYLLRVRGASNDVEGALDVIRSYWGGMLELGATSFWEEFDTSWLENGARIDEICPDGMVDIHANYGKDCYKGYRRSLCHGWASGPTAFLSQYVLGVRISEPGCKKVIIRPRLGGLEWVRGKYPTPYGCIEIEHVQKDGKIESRINAPEGVEVILEN